MTRGAGAGGGEFPGPDMDDPRAVSSPGSEVNPGTATEGSLQHQVGVIDRDLARPIASEWIRRLALAKTIGRQRHVVGDTIVAVAGGVLRVPVERIVGHQAVRNVSLSGNPAEDDKNT